MQQTISLRVLPQELSDVSLIKKYLADAANMKESDISGYHFLKKSIDARAKTIWVNLTVRAFIKEPFNARKLDPIIYRDVRHSKSSTLIVGGGPAGYFAALELLQKGIKPIIIERGKDVKARRRDLAQLNRNGDLNPESNYCFGEGGAGTYSDGKLYTRSNKRGSIDQVLHQFVRFGADENILFEAHPHIGTNKLPHIMVAMREQIINSGGEVHFQEKLIDFDVENDLITKARTESGKEFPVQNLILATGHSARDIYELLDRKNILLEPKPFALGVRIEHPQELINNCQYKSNAKSEFLPPAAYSLVEQVNGRGVFSFCMCPGGIIAPAATSPGELVVNGWSPSKRNNAKANSGMVVQVGLTDIKPFIKEIESPLALMRFQQLIERKAFDMGGGNFVAPAQRMVDFCMKKTSIQLPDCSYHPGLNSVGLNEVLPSFIFDTLSSGFVAFGKKMKGYFTNEALIVATESRTSAPVRIPRDAESLTHTQISNLYPCAEGAGYAGGIVSAAMDGIKVGAAIATRVG